MAKEQPELYRQVSAEQVENDYTLKLINKSQETRRYRITLEAADAGLTLSGPNVVEAGPEQVLPVALSVAGGSDVHGRRLIRRDRAAFVIVDQFAVHVSSDFDGMVRFPSPCVGRPRTQPNSKERAGKAGALRSP